MADNSYDVTLAEVLLEFVRRLYADEVQSAGMTYGANRRLAKRMGVNEHSLGKILLGAVDRQVTVAQLDQYRRNKGMRVSEILMQLCAVAVALEHDEPETKVEAIKLADAKGESYVRRDAFPDGAPVRAKRQRRRRKHDA